MIAIVLFIFLAIWILLTKFAMKIGGYLFRRFRPDNPRAEKWGAFWGFMLAMGWVLVYWAVEAVVVRIYAAQMCKQAGITVYVTPEQWRNLTKESADNLRKNAPFSFKKNVYVESYNPVTDTINAGARTKRLFNGTVEDYKKQKK